MKRLVFALALLLANNSFSQKLPSVQIIRDSINSSLRGLSVPSDHIVWVSGSDGTVGRSVDAGKNWQWMVVPGFEKRDFRDIEAFDSLTAIIMAVDNPGNILKTTDGGKNWKVVFHKEQEGMFLDAMHFKDGKGICIGDPILIDSGLQVFYILSSYDQGDKWDEIYLSRIAEANNGEAVFAGSGTNISLLTKGNQIAFVSGGTSSNLYLLSSRKKKKIAVPILQGQTSTGAFSLCSGSEKEFYITGGDYVEYWKDSGNVLFTLDAGKTWKRSSVHGYRSCIIQTDKKTFITCGTNGVDISFDGCKTWKLIHGDGAKGKDGFNVCAKSKTGKAVYFAGTGRIGKLIP